MGFDAKTASSVSIVFSSRSLGMIMEIVNPRSARIGGFIYHHFIKILEIHLSSIQVNVCL